eukprot:3784463-Ditylum_brightwellii.AAC.1
MGLQLLFSNNRSNDIPVFLVSAYHPDSKKPQEEFDTFMENFSTDLDEAVEDSILIVGSDANIKLGRNVTMEADNNQSFHSKVMGPFGFHPSPNKRGELTARILAAHSLTLAATWFEKNLIQLSDVIYIRNICN